MTTIEAPPLAAVEPPDHVDILLPQGSRILHIGPPKTGTTALQAAFHLGRQSTERQGVHYASHGRHAMSAVLAGIEQPSPWALDRRPPSKWAWNRLVGDIRGSKARRVVLSSEFFADASSEAINRVVTEIGPEDIQIVVTLRPLARIMPSQWQQFVQNQLTVAFDDWIDGVLNRPRGKMTPMFWKRHRHDELVARWVDVVGPDRLTVVALDDNDRDMVLRVFERLTGLAVGTLVTEPDLSNRSMTVPEIETVRAFNKTFRDDKLPAPLYSRVMRFGAAAYMRNRQPSPEEARIELPEWSVEPIANLAREMMAAIEATGVRIVGNLDLMTKVPAGRTPTQEPIVISPTVAASTAMGVLMASGLARGSGSIVANESEGIEGDERLQRAPRPVQEPPELLRISTAQLAVVMFRRGKAALWDRFGRLAFWRRR